MNNDIQEDQVIIGWDANGSPVVETVPAKVAVPAHVDVKKDKEIEKSPRVENLT